MSGQQNGDESGSLMIILIVFSLAIFWGGQYLIEQYIYAWYYIKQPMVYGYYLIPENIRPILFFWIEKIQFFQVSDINYFINSLKLDFDKGLYHIVEKNKNGFLDINKTSIILNYMLLPFLALPIILMTKRIMSVKNFNKTLNLNTFTVEQSERWPVIKPVIYLDKNTINSIDEGPWAMSMRPEDFFGYEYFHFFEDGEPVKIDQSKDISVYMSSFDFSINISAVYDYFLNQLGKKWSGLEGLGIEEKHLLMILLPKIHRNGSEANEILDLLGNYYSSKKGFKEKMRKRKLAKIVDKKMKNIISKYFDTPEVQNIIKKNHFTNTVFMSLLQSARQDGTLSNGLFLWLKPLNRTLWYSLSSLGRQLPFPDSASVWSHYIHEKSLGVSITIPKIKNAVESVDLYFSDRFDHYIPYKEIGEMDK